jgi:hypothetical protein
MIIGLAIFCIFLPLFCHLFVIRGLSIFRQPLDRQKGVIFSAAAGMIVLFIILTIVFFQSNGFGEVSFWFGLYILVCYFLSAYIYFHIFNMSETSRRIKILLQADKGGLDVLRLENEYPVQEILRRRLNRLTALGQLCMINQRYVLQGKVLLYSARIVFALRKIIFPYYPE